MNKSTLVNHVSAELGVSKAEAARATDAVFAALADGLTTHGKVTVSGFGTFARRQRAARKGVNPTTRQAMIIPPSATCAFRPAPALRDLLSDSLPMGNTAEISDNHQLSKRVMVEAKAAAKDVRTGKGS